MEKIKQRLRSIFSKKYVQAGVVIIFLLRLCGAGGEKEYLNIISCNSDLGGIAFSTTSGRLYSYNRLREGYMPMKLENTKSSSSKYSFTSKKTKTDSVFVNGNLKIEKYVATQSSNTGFSEMSYIYTIFDATENKDIYSGSRLYGKTFRCKSKGFVPIENKQFVRAVPVNADKYNMGNYQSVPTRTCFSTKDC